MPGREFRGRPDDDGVLHRHDRVRRRRDPRAGCDPDGATRRHLEIGRTPGAHLAHDPQADRRGPCRAGYIIGMHREPIHRAVVPWRQVQEAPKRLGQNHTEGFVERYVDGRQRFACGCEDPILRRVDAQHWLGLRFHLPTPSCTAISATERTGLRLNDARSSELIHYWQPRRSEGDDDDPEKRDRRANEIEDRYGFAEQ